MAGNYSTSDMYSAALQELKAGKARAGEQIPGTNRIGGTGWAQGVQEWMNRMNPEVGNWWNEEVYRIANRPQGGGSVYRIQARQRELSELLNQFRGTDSYDIVKQIIGGEMQSLSHQFAQQTNALQQQNMQQRAIQNFHAIYGDTAELPTVDAKFVSQFNSDMAREMAQNAVKKDLVPEGTQPSYKEYMKAITQTPEAVKKYAEKLGVTGGVFFNEAGGGLQYSSAFDPDSENYWKATIDESTPFGQAYASLYSSRKNQMAYGVPSEDVLGVEGFEVLDPENITYNDVLNKMIDLGYSEELLPKKPGIEIDINTGMPLSDMGAGLSGYSPEIAAQISAFEGAQKAAGGGEEFGGYPTPGEGGTTPPVDIGLLGTPPAGEPIGYEYGTTPSGEPLKATMSTYPQYNVASPQYTMGAYGPAPTTPEEFRAIDEALAAGLFPAGGTIGGEAPAYPTGEMYTGPVTEEGGYAPPSGIELPEWIKPLVISYDKTKSIKPLSAQMVKNLPAEKMKELSAWQGYLQAGSPTTMSAYLGATPQMPDWWSSYLAQTQSAFPTETKKRPYWSKAKQR